MKTQSKGERERARGIERGRRGEEGCTDSHILFLLMSCSLAIHKDTNYIYPHPQATPNPPPPPPPIPPETKSYDFKLQQQASKWKWKECCACVLEMRTK